MSLIKQLWLAIVVILTLAFAGAFVLNTMASKHYFEDQLQAKNFDNATTLALSMTQMEKDPVTLDLLLSAQFDSGHYEYIGLLDPNGKIISERINKNSQSKAPNWFLKLIQLELQPGLADIQDGWSQYGSLKIMSDSTFAYDKLWDNTIISAVWVMLIAIIGCLAGSQILKRILNPLNDVVRQAESIGENRFVTINVPKTKEFKAVANAMNTLSNRIKKTVSEESARLDKLRLDNNFDQVTELMNRDYFIQNADAIISHEEYFHEGVLAISRITNLGPINQKLGRQKTDEMLKTIGDSIRDLCKQHPELSAGRISGADFSLFSSQPKDSYAIGNQFKKLLEKVSHVNDVTLAVNFITVAIRVSNADSAIKTIDTILKVIDEIGADKSNVLHVINPDDLNQYENSHQSEWLNILTSAITNKRIKLETYPVINQAGALIHFEAPVRLQLAPDGKWSSAGEFITWAMQLNLIGRIDELVCETAVQSLSKGSPAIGLNVSSSAMCSASYIENLTTLIKANPNVAEKLYLEVPEQDAFNHLLEFHDFCSQIKPLGCKIGIEHVGSRISRLGELHDVGLDYIKIDASVIRSIDTNEANRTLLRGLCMIAHSLGVLAIAEGVQTDYEIATLKQIGIDGMTGPGIKI